MKSVRKSRYGRKSQANTVTAVNYASLNVFLAAKNTLRKPIIANIK